jgi:hypothetical protein
VAGNRSTETFRRATSAPHTSPTEGQLLGGFSSSGGSLVYSLVQGKAKSSTCSARQVRCTVSYSGGGVWQVVDGRPLRVQGAVGSFLTATAAGKLAEVLPIDDAHAGHVIQVRILQSGALLSTIDVKAPILAVALSGNLLAVITGVESRGPQSLTRIGAASPALIEWYSVAGGKALGKHALPKDSGTELAASGTSLIFRVGHQLRLLDTKSGIVTRLARGKFDPYSVSIAGSRLLWAEPTTTGSAIKTLALSPE